MCIKVAKAFTESIDIGFTNLFEIYATVPVQSLKTCDKDDSARDEPCAAALNVKELLGTEIATETSLSDCNFA